MPFYKDWNFKLSEWITSQKSVIKKNSYPLEHVPQPWPQLTSSITNEWCGVNSFVCFSINRYWTHVYLQASLMKPPYKLSLKKKFIESPKWRNSELWVSTTIHFEFRNERKQRYGIKVNDSLGSSGIVFFSSKNIPGFLKEKILREWSNILHYKQISLRD
jgi:hypothetical protein